MIDVIKEEAASGMSSQKSSNPRDRGSWPSRLRETSSAERI